MPTPSDNQDPSSFEAPPPNLPPMGPGHAAGPPSAPFSRPPRPLPLPPPVRRARWVVSSLLALVIASVVALTYLRIERELHTTLKDKLLAILNANVHSAEEWLTDQKSLARALSQQPAMNQAALEALGLQPDLHRVRSALRTAAGSLLSTDLVSEVVLFNHRGEPLVSTDPDQKLIPLDSELLRQVERTGSHVFVASPEDGDTWNERVAALAPIEQAGVTRAFLCLLVDAESLNRRLHVISWGKSGETFAFDHSGVFLTSERFRRQLRHGTPSHHDEAVLPHPTSWTGEAPSSHPAIQQVVKLAPAGSRGVDVVGYRGYLGREVVGSWRWLHPYGFGIATEISRSEAYQSVSVLRAAFVTLATLVGLALLGFLMLGRWTLRVRQESALVNARLGRLARTIQPLSAALENDPSAVLLVNSSGRVVYANASSHRVLDIHTPLIGQTIEGAFSGLAAELRAALDSGQDSIVARGPEEEGETLLVSSRVLRIDGKKHFLYMLRPVTQQVRRQEIVNLRKLIRVLSHELNNSLAPITSLLNSARTLNARASKDEKLERIFEAIDDRTQHLAVFLKRYGAVARLPHPSPVRVSWNTFIDGLAHQGTFQLKGELPSEPGFFDPIQLERVLLNLVANSREAGSRPEDIELSVTDDQDGVTIEVQDRGSGMPEKVLRQAMLPFFSTKDSGTGIGLALSREIVEGHGGNMVLANREGGGLTASCYLPKQPYDQSRGSLSQLRVSLLAGGGLSGLEPSEGDPE